MQIAVIALALLAVNPSFSESPIQNSPKTSFGSEYKDEYVSFLFHGTHLTEGYVPQKNNTDSTFRLRFLGLLDVSACFVFEYPVKNMGTVEKQLKKGNLIFNQGLSSEKAHPIKNIKTKYGFVNPATSSVWLYVSIPVEDAFEYGLGSIIIIPLKSITLFCPLPGKKQSEWRWVENPNLK